MFLAENNINIMCLGRVEKKNYSEKVSVAKHKKKVILLFHGITCIQVFPYLHKQEKTYIENNQPIINQPPPSNQQTK